ncbi:EAL domain-containing protein [Vibrio salinus]|uniref:EAL domain-containing protein n=1 Tax=Vibrio salinus TaxID=2899784 RepID=UPI001E6280A8|nr:EAL domain-containing protein [Vibrio salinus]MCE0495962.1 cyclic diguanylate phosphodiesterase [Vibrio salinus]
MKKKRLFIFSLHLFGILTISVFGFFRLETAANTAAIKLQETTINLFNQTEIFYNHTLSKTITGGDCQEFLKVSEPFLYQNPYIRSITLSDGGTITCSTISKNKKIKMKNWRPLNSENQLFYTDKTPFKNRELTMQRGVLLLRIPMSRSIATTFAYHPDFFKQALTTPSNFHLSLHFDDIVFTSSGIFHQKDTEKPDHILQADLFGTSYKITYSDTLHYIFANYGILLLMWMALITFAGSPLYKNFENYNLAYFRIKKGIKRKQFEPYLQPSFDIDGNLTGAELLARWVHPKKGIISPSEFIEIAENNGQIIEITNQLINKTIKKLQQHHFNKKLFLSINICPAQFENDDLFNDCILIKNKLLKNNIEPILELTERMELTNNKLYMNYIDRLQKQNFLIALDDFGTGHCSLKYIHQVNVNFIKIDKSYINTIDDNNSNTNILDNIIDLAKRIQVPLVAEGIETQTQLDYLRGKQIRYYQGFFFERPISIDNFIKKYHSENQ